MITSRNWWSIHSWFRDEIVILAEFEKNIESIVKDRPVIVPNVLLNTLSYPLSRKINYLLRTMQWTMHPLWKPYLFRKFTMDPLSLLPIKYEFRVCLAHYGFRVLISLWIHYFIRELTMKSLSFLQNHYEFTLIFHFMFTIIFFVDSLWIHHLFQEFTIKSLFRQLTINPLCFLRIHYKLTICFANLL